MSAPPASAPVPARQERLRAGLERRKLVALVVTDPINIFYLTGFRGSAGAAVFTNREAVLWVDPRYTLQAREQTRGMEVIQAKGRLLKAVAGWLERRRATRVGYDEIHLTCAAYREFEGFLDRSRRLEPAGGLVEDLRYIKDATEIQCIREAGKITAAAFEETARMVRAGMSEAEVAAEIEYRLRRKGAEGAAFETIVASGPRSALPHARASAKLLRKSELVILDLGAILSGYAADMTRTLYLGEPGRRVRRLYEAVRAAQARAVEALQTGTPAEKVDAAARSVLASRGLGRYIVHSTGHGVGLEVHEKPRLGRTERLRLQAGCVVTAEPGIYLEGFGGIRIEDTVLVGVEAPEILTPASKDAWVVAG